MVRLTVDYIVKNNGNTKLKRDETTEQYLKRITHLYMSERNIDEIVRCFGFIYQIIKLFCL